MRLFEEIEKYENIKKIITYCLLINLIIESVAYQIPSIYRADCDCGEYVHGEVEIICPSPTRNLLREHPIHPFSYFQILYKPENFVDFQCYETANGFNFPYNLASEVQSAKKIIIKDCYFGKNSSLVHFVEVLSTKIPNVLGFQDYRAIEFSLSQDNFLGLTELKELLISKNENLTNLNDDLLKFMPNLEKIHINNNNNLKIVPKTIFQYVTNLTYLTLANNFIESLNSQTFGNLTKLLDLYLSENRITEIHPKTFDNLSSLVVLELNGNKLQSLPGEIFINLKKLQDLNLSRNEFKTLPATSFSGLSNLMNLDLSGNQLELLPDDIFVGLKRLRKLNLRENKLSTISGSLFSDLVNLKEFEADNNKIVKIEDDAFVNLKNVDIIKLSHNNLRDLTRSVDPYFGTISVFSECNSLKELHLSFNEIPKLYLDWIIYSKPSFKLLNLSHNFINELKVSNSISQTDDPAKDVELNIFHADKFKMDLSHNQIKHVSLRSLESYFSSSKRNEILVDLSDNPILCDCSVYDLLTYLDGSMSKNVTNILHLDTQNLRCSFPKMYKEFLVSDIKSKDFKCPFDTLALSRGDIFCPRECTTTLHISENTAIVDCFLKQLNRSPQIICTPDNYEIELNLGNNALTEIPNLFRPYFINVKKLLLQANNIETINDNVFTSRLEVLELHDNAITRIGFHTINLITNSILKSITLSGNPWICDCFARDFLNFVQNTKLNVISDASTINCHKTKLPLKTITINELCPLNITNLICNYEKDHLTKIWDEFCPVA